MLFFIIMVVVIIIASMCIIDKFDSASDLNAVNHDYANEAIKFFNSYLSLYKNHSVRGICDICYKGKEQRWINTEMTCTIISIDGEHADEEFEQIKNIWLGLRQEKMDAGEYASITYAGDGYIKDYFGCEDLHYAFTEADEYQFENGQVVMSLKRIMVTANGSKWRSTLEYIRDELQKKWPNANITLDKAGIIVKS